MERRESSPSGRFLSTDCLTLQQITELAEGVQEREGHTRSEAIDVVLERQTIFAERNFKRWQDTPENLREKNKKQVIL